MRKLVLAIVAGVISLGAIAQPSSNRTSKKRPHSPSTSWTKGALLSISASQGSSKYWSPGSQEFSLAVNGFASLYANKKWGKNTWDNSLDASFGLFNATDLGFRKNDDRIDFRSHYGHTLTKTLNVGALFNFRSQFVDGYDYSDGQKRRISDFFAPAYFALGPGVEYKPSSNVSIFISPAAGRLVVFTNRPYSYQYQGGVLPDGGTEIPLSSKYGVDPDREVDPQFGTFVSININKEIFKNVSYRTRADLFSNYLQAKPLNIDVFWTNAVIMKVNKFLQVTYNFDVNYDDDIRLFGPTKSGTRFQFRSMLGVGIAARF
jgi:hypothetical protein